MNADTDGRPDEHSDSRRWHLSVINTMRLVAATLAGGIFFFALYFHLWLERSIVVDAETGALEVELAARFDGKAFREFWLCERKDAGGIPAPNSPKAVGCPAWSHHLVGPVVLTTPPALPAGTKLKIATWPGMLRIDVKSIPGPYRGTDAGRLEGGAIILLGQDTLAAFGTMTLTGKVRIGASPSETDRMSVVSGNYQIRGYTPIGWLWNDMRQLRGGTILAGAFTRFATLKGDTADGSVAIMLPDLETSLMRVTAISDLAPNAFAVSYYYTKEVLVRPSFLEALILDPLLQLLATVLGTVVGYGWLKRLVLSRYRNAA